MFNQDGEDDVKMFAKIGKPHTPMLLISGPKSVFSAIASDIIAEISEHGSTAAVPNSGYYPAEEDLEAFTEAVVTSCQDAGLYY